MNYAAITILFVVSVMVTIRRGPGGSFAYVFLPVLLLLSSIRAVSFEPLPDITSTVAISYGAIVGGLIAGKLTFFKLHLVDFLVLACSMSIVATGAATGEMWTVVATSGTEILRWLVPYYMGRLAFRDPMLRRHMALTLAFIAMFIGFVGLIEFRLWPYTYANSLAPLGLNSATAVEVLRRWVFFRAMVSTDHPIDLGNTGLVLAGLIAAMAVTGGVPLKDWRIRCALISCAIMVAVSMSFSSIIGSAIGIFVYVVLRYVPRSEALLLPGLAAAILGGFVVTNHLLSIDLEAIKPADETAAALEGSFYIRTLIVQNTWNLACKYSGWFGWGDFYWDERNLGLKSVDNSYLLFLMKRGWVHLTLRLMLALSIAHLGYQMLKGARGAQMRGPPAALLGSLIGTLAAMYTVWFGFVYAVLWTCTLALAVTMRQVLAEQAQRVATRGATIVPRPMPRRRYVPQEPPAPAPGGGPLTPHPAS